MTEAEDIFLRGYLGEILPEAEYYTLTLLSDENGRTFKTTQTYFKGWADGKPGAELRAPSVVGAHHMINSWKLLGQSPAVVINNTEQFWIYMAYFGGNALIERTVAEAKMPEFFRASRAVNLGPGAGFSSSDEDLKAASRRFPAPRSRMDVLRRDKYRCRLCGRSVEDALDLRLHTHHIREYASGGPTLPWNLITLCQTCHEGLDVPEQQALYAKIDDLHDRLNNLNAEYWSGVRLYREQMSEEFSKIEKRAKKPRAPRRSRGRR